MPDSLPIAAFILIGTSALLLAIGVTPLMRRLALQTGTVDKPAARKIHASPVPLLGGAAIYVAFILVLLFFGDRDYVNQTIGIFAGATLMIVMGVLDDRRGLGSYVKLLGQLLAATLLVYSGVQIQLFGGWIDILITLLWVVGITNALNLLDNMDGLSGGVAMIAAIYFTLLAAMSDQYLVGALAAALAGACAGFLVYNWNPSHIFMGDAGSLFLGFMLAAVAIKLRFPSNSVTVTWMIPLLVLGLPIFDTSMVFVSRLRRGKDRRKVHYGDKTPVSVHQATAEPLDLAHAFVPDTTPSPDGQAEAAHVEVEEHEPGHIVRVKEHPAKPMTVDDALYEMELVGHDFFLFHDKESDRPTVVYRRHAYDYGLIRLA